MWQIVFGSLYFHLESSNDKRRPRKKEREERCENKMRHGYVQTEFQIFTCIYLLHRRATLPNFSYVPCWCQVNKFFNETPVHIHPAVLKVSTVEICPSCLTYIFHKATQQLEVTLLISFSTTILCYFAWRTLMNLCFYKRCIMSLGHCYSQKKLRLK